MHLDPVSSGAWAPTLRPRKPEARNLAYSWTRCPCASSATGERRSSPVPEAPDIIRRSRAHHAPLAGRRGLRHRAHRHPHAAAQRAARLQRLGGAARRAPAPGEAAERRRDVSRPYGRGYSAQVPCGERGVARLCVSRRTALVALVGKVAHVWAVVSLVVVTPLRSAHDSMLVGASGVYGTRGSVI